MTSIAGSSPPRFWVEDRLSPGAMLDLPAEVARHVAALRLREGDAIALFNGAGGEHAATLARVAKNQCVAKIGERRDVERESTLQITLALGISAGDRMDFAVQKATELGVVRIVPLETERAVVRLAAPRAERRLAHWRAVAVAACEQCGRNRVPELAPVVAFDEFLQQPGEGLRLLLSPAAGKRLADFVRSEAVTILIGPEGGLSPGERSRALERGFSAVRFGPRVLRTETAPLAAIAALQALWGDC
jgi:16S rRNA (uracil1498-N3)-methyltransferase